jgi:hypothetical protein
MMKSPQDKSKSPRGRGKMEPQKLVLKLIDFGLSQFVTLTRSDGSVFKPEFTGTKLDTT